MNGQTSECGKACAIYARTACQDAIAMKSQIERCRAKAEQLEWRIEDEHIFVDDACSGSGLQNERPGRDALLQGVKEGKFDRILVESLDRLSRNLVFGLRLMETFAAHNVDVIFTDEALDSNQLIASLEWIATADLSIAKTIRTKKSGRGAR